MNDLVNHVCCTFVFSAVVSAGTTCLIVSLNDPTDPVGQVGHCRRAGFEGGVDVIGHLVFYVGARVVCWTDSAIVVARWTGSGIARSSTLDSFKHRFR